MTASSVRLADVERHRRRIWGLCYRMTGDALTAEDLAQESMAKAIERIEQAADDTIEGWLYRIATTTCLDWLRRTRRERAAVALVDPVDLEDAPWSTAESPDGTLLRREDVRLAILASLQHLAPRQRAVLVLRDVFDRSTDETAAALGITSANVKVLLHRARARLAEVHRVGPCDEPADTEVVERFASALEAGDVDRLTSLLADDVWGLVDDGVGRRRPTVGPRAVSRQWANALARYGRADHVCRVRLNGEAALVVVASGVALASIHLETRAPRVASIRVVLDPPRLARLGIGA